jgi:LemA protein
MKKSWIILAVIAVLVILLYVSVKNTFNRMVQKGEVVTEQWANVENVYQRRSDLIPNLVNTVKGYADFEQETLTQVIEARSRATSVTVDADNLSPDMLSQFQEAQAGLSSALSRLLVVIERYPDLKANQNFLELQAQLEGTENRIAVERRRFNEVARDYNTFIKQFPRNIYASIFNFESKAYFEAEEEASEVPEVQF